MYAIYKNLFVDYNISSFKLETKRLFNLNKYLNVCKIQGLFIFQFYSTPKTKILSGHKYTLSESQIRITSPVSSVKETNVNHL